MKDYRENPTVLDLFSGCGGMSWGLHLDGFEILGAIDEWSVALDTFKLNHPSSTTFHGDIRELSSKIISKKIRADVDVIIGGPPCQGFSKNVIAKNRFIDDPRNQLFREFIRFVEDVRPKVVVMENVAEIYNAYNGEVREEINQLLQSFGYEVDVKVLNAADYGVPQKRKRCIFLASLKGTPKIPIGEYFDSAKYEKTLQIEGGNRYISAWDAISDLPVLEPGEGKVIHENKYLNSYQLWVRNGSNRFDNHFYKIPSAIQLARYESLKPGQAIKDLPDDLRPKSGYSGAYGRLDFSSVSPTITRWVFHSGSGRFGHPMYPRTLTMREAARIQSFTDDFKFAGSRNDVAGQIGNAVPPLLMLRLAGEIRRLINS